MDTLIKVKKNIARQAYENGSTVTLNPCNFKMPNAWHTHGEFNNNMCELSFDTIVNQFEAYNCINSKTGKRASYFINAEHATHLKPNQYKIDY